MGPDPSRGRKRAMNIIQIQPAMPSYRLDFFRRLGEHFGSRFRVYYSPVCMGSLTAERVPFGWEQPIGPMRPLMRGVDWQVGAISIPMNKGDLVVVTGAPRTLSTLLVLLKARLVGARSIWWGQYWSATSHPRRLRVRMFLARLADSLLFYTDDEVARFMAAGWRHGGPVAALNNGIALDDIRRLRKPYTRGSRAQNVLFIGRLTEKAKLHLMIAAMTHPPLAELQLHVIGDGDDLLPALQAQAEAAGVADRITWHGGKTDEASIAEVANGCAAFVYPGEVGLSLIHAMGYGLPCVVHSERLHHMPEISAFEEGRSGRMFEEGSEKSLAVTLSELLADPELRVRMSDRCKEITDHDYSTEEMAQRFIEFASRVSGER